MALLLFFAFVSGLSTILAPCIWPLLPIVLSSSATSPGHRRPLGITLGIMISFSVFTLAVSSLVMFFHFDPNVLRTIAVIIIAFFGLSMILPWLNNAMEIIGGRVSSFFGSTPAQRESHGFSGGFITGLSLGVVWAPCAGPILATIATLAATNQVSSQAVLITAAYVLGVGIPLFIFSYGGRHFMQRLKILGAYSGNSWIFGLLMLATALAIYTNYDKVIQAKLLNLFPQYSQVLTNFESNPVVKEQLDLLKGLKGRDSSSPAMSDFGAAPKFVGITKWLNLPSDKKASGSENVLTMQDLKGKVVLVDFWTYTCINCIRTLPYVTSWYDKYKDKGFVVVGVHTPEFEFEKNTANVENAIKMYNIHYPVAQDNSYATWNAYSNQYWPAEYLIDANGVIRHTHFGEGEYDQTEKAIQELLKEAGATVSADMVAMPDETPRNQLSPETYLGASRMQYWYPNGRLETGTHKLVLDTNIPQNSFSLGGTWNITPENAVSDIGSALVYNFHASKVHLVLRPPAGKKAMVRIYLDGKLIDPSVAGSDVKDGVITVDMDRLYNLVDLHGTYGNHTLKLEFLTPQTELFAFTFG